MGLADDSLQKLTTVGCGYGIATIAALIAEEIMETEIILP